MNNEIVRRSPVSFSPRPVKEKRHGDFNVVLAYENEGDGPCLVDLSHCPRWDFQDADIGNLKPMDITVPEKPGECAIKSGISINRMNGTQAALWHLASQPDRLPEEPGFTDVTDATVFLALIGKAVFNIAEKLTALDLTDPAISAPVLIQGPFAHVPCQIVVIPEMSDYPGILLTCSRGYAHDMVKTILEAGESFDLKPAGITQFNQWLTQNRFVDQKKMEAS